MTSAFQLNTFTMAALDHDRRNKQPRMLTEAERDRLEEFIESIHYSSRLAFLKASGALAVANQVLPDIRMMNLNIGTYSFLRRW